MRDRLPFPEHFKQKTFGEWCDEHSVTDDEREMLLTYWVALRLRKCGLLSIMTMGR